MNSENTKGTKKIAENWILRKSKILHQVSKLYTIKEPYLNSTKAGHPVPLHAPQRSLQSSLNVTGTYLLKSFSSEESKTY